MNTFIEALASTADRGLQGATPLLLAAGGELLAERAGLVNIGIEGVMLCGALAAAAAGWASGSVLVALAAGLATGALVGLLFAVWTVWAARDQIVTGLAINLIALGATSVMAERYEAAAAARGAAFVAPRLATGGFADPLLWTSLLLMVALSLLLRYTRPGLTLRAVGENPEAAESSGIRVGVVRTLAAVIGAALAGLAGAYLVCGMGDRFQDNLTAGRGFVALALVIFGRWSPGRIAAAALFFGMLDALQVTLQPRLGTRVHTLYPLLLALPYVLTLAVLARSTRRIRPPAALGVPYARP